MLTEIMTNELVSSGLLVAAVGIVIYTLYKIAYKNE
jgi:hypothetical protein